MTTASDTIISETTSWPGVQAGPGPRGGELSIRFGAREIDHLHGDHAAHFGFPKALWHVLREQGRIVPHPVFGDRPGPAARAIRSEEDVRDVIALPRLNYERAQTPPRGIRPSAPQVLPFDAPLHIRAFALEREAGHLLVYSVDGLLDEAVECQYLTHWHEAMLAEGDPGVPLYVHEADAPQTAERTHVRAAFSRRHTLGGDFTAIPIPGHTPARPPTCGTAAATDSSSRATRSTCATASGSSRCSTPATARPTPTACGRSASWTSTCSSRGRRPPASRGGPAPTGPTRAAGSTRF